MLKHLLFLGILGLTIPFLSAQTYQTHQVVAGETLYGLSKRYQTTPGELKQLNQLGGSTIYVGQELMIPLQQANNQAVTASSAEATTNTQPNLRSLSSATTGTDAGTNTGVDPNEALRRLNSSSGLATQAEDVWARTNLSMLGDLRRTGATSSRDRSTSVVTRSTQAQRQGSQAINTRSGNTSNSRLSSSQQGRQNQGINTSHGQERTYHRVARNEDIYDVAEQYGVSVQELQKWNKTRSVYTGQVLTIYQDTYAAIIDPDAKPLTQIENQLTGGGGTKTKPLTAPDARVAEPSNEVTETGTYRIFEWPDTRERYYLAHPILPVGTKVQLQIPGGDGYLTLTVVAYHNPGSSTDFSLSTDAARMIEALGGGREATLVFEQPTKSASRR